MKQQNVQCINFIFMSGCDSSCDIIYGSDNVMVSYLVFIKDVAWLINNMSLILGQQSVVQCFSASLKQNLVHFYAVKPLFVKDF